MAKGLRSLAIVFAIIGLVFIFIGFGKKNIYENSDYSWGKHTNVYVGGDAYNYIINGTYFTGYVVLGGALLVVGSVFYVGGALIEAMDDTKKKMAVGDTSSVSSAVGNGVWKCPDCGKENPNYTGTCGCGCSKP